MQHSLQEEIYPAIMESNRKIFFDLDGTLIDARKRLYDLFQDLVPQSTFSFDQYWNIKRSKYDHHTILINNFGYNKEGFNIFEEKWLNLIETRKYLEKDTVFAGITDMLDTLKKNYKLYVVSSRQNTEIACDQLKKLGLFIFFDNVFFTEHKKTKEVLIKNSCQTSPDDFLIGDTGYDILTGKKLGLKTIAVSYGFLSREILLTYNPDIIIDNSQEIINKISMCR
jgi:phosphoglycolate phosphatase